MNTGKILFLLCCIFFIVSCGNDSSSSESSLNADFVADSPVPQSGSVTLQKNRVSGDIVYVDVRIMNLSGAFGADIKLDFDGSKLALAGEPEAGNFLERGGTPYYTDYQTSTGHAFTVVLFAGQGEAVDGDGVLVTIPFKVLVSGEWSIDFNSDSKITDSSANIIPVSSSLWGGGATKGY